MTKLIPLLAAAFVAVAGAAAAEKAFTFDRAQSTASSMTLTNVQADQAGTIRVYVDHGANGFGQNPGSARIDAGVTGDLAIALREPFAGDLAIVTMGPDHWVAKMTTRAPRERGPERRRARLRRLGARAGQGAAPAGADCVVTSSDVQLVHDRRGNVVSC